MYEGFSDYQAFVDSISDGFTGRVNDLLPLGAELLSNDVGYHVLCTVFGDKLSTKQLRAVTDSQIDQLRTELEKFCELELSKEQVVDCLRGALNQSVGDPSLDRF